MGTRHRRHDCVGVAIGEDSVTFAALDCAGAEPLQVRCGEIPLERMMAGGAELWAARAGERLRQALLTAGITARRAVVALPLRQLRFQTLAIPKARDEEFARLVRMEAASAMGLKPHEVTTAFHPVLRGAGNASFVDVLAVSATTDDADRAVKLVRHAAVTVEAIDAWPHAMGRAMHAAPGGWGAPKPRLIIGLSGASRITCLLDAAGRPDFVRAANCRSEELLEIATDDSPGARNVLPAPGVIARDAALTMHHLTDTLSDEARPAVACVMGAGPLEQSYMEALRALVPIPVVPWCDLLNPQLREALSASCPSATMHRWTLPTGLALYDQVLSEAAA